MAQTFTFIRIIEWCFDYLWMTKQTIIIIDIYISMSFTIAFPDVSAQTEFGSTIATSSMMLRLC